MEGAVFVCVYCVCMLVADGCQYSVHTKVHIVHVVCCCLCLFFKLHTFCDSTVDALSVLHMLHICIGV